MNNSNKNKIISAAMRLFWSQGVSRIGINQIIMEAGVAKASFYYHFKTKDDLVKECINLFNNYQINTFDTLANKCETIESFIAAWIEDVKSAREKDENYRGCPVANIGFSLENNDGEMTALYRELFREWHNKIQNFMYKLKATKKMDSTEDPEILTKRIIQALEGAMTMWRLTGDFSYVDDLQYVVPSIVKR